MKYTVLAGGTGAARFIRGLVREVPAEDVTVITNVADDDEIWGLHISPDTDTILYMLSGQLDEAQGWGVQADTFRCKSRLAALGVDDWFQIGDADLATHIARTLWLREGLSLTEITRRLAARWNVRPTVLPVTDDRLRTLVECPSGTLRYQEYFVRHRAEVAVTGIRHDGAMQARPTADALNALRNADHIILAPSNPVTSIGPMIAMQEFRSALADSQARVSAVSPLRGNRSFSGPASALMKACGLDVSVVGLADYYLDLLDEIVIDSSDENRLPELLSRGFDARSTSLSIGDLESSRRVARFVIDEHDHTVAR